MKTGFRAKFYPNGEFTLGYVSDRRIKEAEPTDPNAFRYGQLWWFNAPEYRRLVEKWVAEGRYSPLDLSNPPNSHRRRGMKGITRNGSRLVRNTAHMMQQKWGRKVLSFLTLTVPPVSEDEEKKLCLEWSRIIRVFCQRLKRMLEAQGLPPVYVGVTEVQEKRWNQYQQVGLHVHIVFVGRRTAYDDWAFTPTEFREAWLSVLSTVLDRDVESRSCENLQMVKKSASGYLGKYMSKGCRIVNEIAESKGSEYIPTAWYTCAMPLKNAYKKSIRQAWDEDVNIIARLPLLCLAGVVKHVGITKIEIGGREVLVGISGKFEMDKVRQHMPNVRHLIPSRHTYNQFLEV